MSQDRISAGAAGQGFSEGMHIAVAAMGGESHDVVERQAVGVESLLVDISVAGVCAAMLHERVYVAYPDEQHAAVAADYANALLGYFDVKSGHIREGMRPRVMARLFASCPVVIGSKLVFDIAALNTRNGGRHGYRQPDGWVFPEVDLTLIERADQRTLLTDKAGKDRRPGRTIDTLTVMELIGDAWWTGSTAWVGDAEGEARFADLGKTVVPIAPDHQRRAKDYDAVFSTVEQARDFAEQRVREADGCPVLIGASTSDATAFSARLSAGGIRHELLTADDADRAPRVFAGAGRRRAVTVTSLRLRGQDIRLDSDLNVPGGGLHTIILSPLPSLRDEQHARNVSGREGDHGCTWVVRVPQEAPAPVHHEPDLIITRS